MGTRLTLWKCELDEVLKPCEIFKGVQTIQDAKGEPYIVGVAELWESASHSSGTRFVNVKFVKKDI